MPTIFVTGAAGYIGGHTVNLIAKVHPDWELVALVRTEEQAKIIQKQWPAIKAVVGSLDDHALVSEHSASADVVLQLASSEHPAAVESIIAAMGRGKKGHIIQTTGICTLHSNPNSNGNPSDTIYHDGTDFDFTGCFNTKSSEHTITATGMKHGVSTAIVCPAPVFGTGNGPIRRRSTHFSYLIEAILKRGKGFTVKDGKFTMTIIHIDDVASAVVILINRSLRLEDGFFVNPSMYYFLGTTEESLDKATRTIVEIARARRAIHVATIENLDPGQAAQIHPWAPILWGTNCIGRSERLRGLGWQPKGPCLFDSLPEMVDFEIEFLAAQDEEHIQTWQIQTS